MFKFFVDRVTGGHPENRGRAGTAAGIAGIFLIWCCFSLS